MARLIRLLMLLVAPLWLTSCLLVPTKFASTLDIGADRSFTFTYAGEVQLLKTSKPDSPSGEWPGDEGSPPLDEGSTQGWDEDGGGEPTLRPIAVQSSQSIQPGAAGDTAEEEAQLRRLAETLSKEYGFRSVRYVGNHTLTIDYRISGRLDHGFVFPFNPDGEVIVPFIAVELRGKDRLRIKAPGFANDSDSALSMGGMSGMAGGPAPGAGLDGQFTLTTNAEIVSQNQENGSEATSDGKKRIVWAVTPETRDAPMAVLRVQPLP